MIAISTAILAGSFVIFSQLIHTSMAQDLPNGSAEFVVRWGNSWAATVVSLNFVAAVVLLLAYLMHDSPSYNDWLVA